MPIRYRMARALGMVLVAGATMAGCSAGDAGTNELSSGRGMSPTSGAPATSSPEGQPSVSPSTPTTTPTQDPTFSPASIRITHKLQRHGEFVLTVVAPPATRFAIGQDANGIPCTAEVTERGGASTYRVVCPPAPAGSRLAATITYGDFDYGFMKTL